MPKNGIFDPMLAYDLKPESKEYAEIFGTERGTRNWMFEPKLDGFRGLICIGEDRKVEWFITRDGKDLSRKLPYHVNDINELGWSPGIYDCEVGHRVDDWQFEYPRISWSATQSVLGSKPEVAVIKQIATPITICLFDFIPANHITKPMVDRKVALGFTNLPLGSKMFDIITAETSHYFDMDKLIREGGEGAILKNISGLYVPGSRRKGNWYKIKRYETADVYVVGFEWGQGKYEHLIGALYFSDTPYGDPIGKCSGMTDTERIEWTNLLCRYSNSTAVAPAKRLIEIKHYGKVGADGKGLRHPQYLKWKGKESYV